MAWLLANWKLLVMGVLLAALGLQTVRVATAKATLAEERQERAEETTERERIARRATERNREIEQERSARAAAQERQKDESILNINARLADALGQLQQRAERPAPSGGVAPSNPSAQASCTGAGLYRPDAAFLIGEAAAAARIAEERDYCHARYDGLHVEGR